MADFDIKLMAEALGKSIENLAPQIEQELNDAVKNVANAAHSAIISRVQGMSMNPKNRQDYLRALQFKQLGDASYIIYLDGEWPNKLEDGFSGYSIKDQLLKSTKKVQVGSRAGQSWVRENAKGKKWAVVPFEHKPFSGEKMSGDLASDIKKLIAKNMAGKEQKLTKTFKDLEGNPLVGKVAQVKNPGDGANPNLAGITKFQHVSDKGAVSSIYMTFRVVSEDSAGWQHSGFGGYGLFQEAEQFVEQELDNILKTIL